MARYLVTLFLAALAAQQAPPKTPSAPAKDDAATLDRYVGRYQFAPEAIMTVSRDGEHLMVQLPGQPKVEIIPDGDNEFFLQVIDAQISFEMNDKDQATALVLHQLGRDQRAPKLEREPVMPKEVTVAPEVFDRHVGEYEFGPTAVITISREGMHFYEQLTGQSKFEIFAKSDREYFLKVVDAQITFDVDGQMRTTSLVLHQGGRELRAVKSP
jgi:serine-type D-Ala-D-Ala carboxypeptidase/endopeptidase